MFLGYFLCLGILRSTEGVLFGKSFISEDHVIFGDSLRIGTMDNLDLRFEVVSAKLRDKRKISVERI